MSVDAEDGAVCTICHRRTVRQSVGLICGAVEPNGGRCDGDLVDAVRLMIGECDKCRRKYQGEIIGRACRSPVDGGERCDGFVVDSGRFQFGGVTVVTAGRSDSLDALFSLSGLLRERNLPHTPFIVFDVQRTQVVVRLVSSAQALVSDYRDDVQAMIQWPGRWRSDYFKLTVGDVRRWLEQDDLIVAQAVESGRCASCLKLDHQGRIGRSCGHCGGRIVRA